MSALTAGPRGPREAFRWSRRRRATVLLLYVDGCKGKEGFPRVSLLGFPIENPMKTLGKP